MTEEDVENMAKEDDVENVFYDQSQSDRDDSAQINRTYGTDGGEGENIQSCCDSLKCNTKIPRNLAVEHRLVL